MQAFMWIKQSSKRFLFVLALLPGILGFVLSWFTLNESNVARAQGNIYLAEWFRYNDGRWEENSLFPSYDARMETYLQNIIGIDEETRLCQLNAISFPYRGYRVTCEAAELEMARSALHLAFAEIEEMIAEMTERRLERIDNVRDASRQLTRELTEEVASVLVDALSASNAHCAASGQDTYIDEAVIRATAYNLSSALDEIDTSLSSLDMIWRGIKVSDTRVDFERIYYDPPTPQSVIFKLSLMVSIGIFFAVGVILGTLRLGDLLRVRAQSGQP